MSWPIVPQFLEEYVRSQYDSTLPPIVDRDPGDENDYRAQEMRSER